MEKIDAAKEARVWKRVLEGRGGFDPVSACFAPGPGVSGELSPARNTPPGISQWSTYDVFTGMPHRQGRQHNAPALPLPALLVLLLLSS